MGNDTMDLAELARYLRRDVREVSKLVSRGQVPGRKVSGEWRFVRAEINQWLETQMPTYTDQELTALEGGGRNDQSGMVVASLLAQASMAVPLTAATKASVLRELVTLAEQTWQVYDPTGLLEAVKQREELGSTALPGGVALPHPRRVMPAILGESLIAYGRTATGIPFGAPNGELSDIFFLICCRDDRTHIKVLARLSRLLLRPGFLTGLREAQTVAESWEWIAAAERELSGTGS
ncbi:MAG: PTS sugar transporter subunit IIA [Gemmataceae bacterium]|nr:PTS sugar transporter subunit IIA [Gemmataceae bacterium]MDW8265284.1 PTS sugar transporter subunit IIA [Gemmataceae bacterium]